MIEKATNRVIARLKEVAKPGADLQVLYYKVSPVKKTGLYLFSFYTSDKKEIKPDHKNPQQIQFLKDLNKVLKTDPAIGFPKDNTGTPKNKFSAAVPDEFYDDEDDDPEYSDLLENTLEFLNDEWVSGLNKLGFKRIF